MASQGKPMAWVTLATTDAYALGALVLAHSLRQAGTAHQLVIMITPGVSDTMRSQLSSTFDDVINVDVLDSGDAAHLALMSRPELGVTLTKLHCWTLTQFSKCVFLDADCLVMTNCDELFERDELSAAPDIGWPDCFNSGVFVFTPSDDTFRALIQLASETGSFDGGDQGLLNTYFGDWATRDISRHLPFVYNMTASATYTYLPAFLRFGRDVKIVHFLGSNKPWMSPHSGDDSSPAGRFHAAWWEVYQTRVRRSDGGAPKCLELPAGPSSQVFCAHTPPPPAHSAWRGAGACPVNVFRELAVEPLWMGDQRQSGVARRPTPLFDYTHTPTVSRHIAPPPPAQTWTPPPPPPPPAPAPAWNPPPPPAPAPAWTPPPPPAPSPAPAPAWTPPPAPAWTPPPAPAPAPAWAPAPAPAWTPPPAPAPAPAWAPAPAPAPAWTPPPAPAPAPAWAPAPAPAWTPPPAPAPAPAWTPAPSPAPAPAWTPPPAPASAPPWASVWTLPPAPAPAPAPAWAPAPAQAPTPPQQNTWSPPGPPPPHRPWSAEPPPEASTHQSRTSPGLGGSKHAVSTGVLPTSGRQTQQPPVMKQSTTKSPGTKTYGAKQPMGQYGQDAPGAQVPGIKTETKTISGTKKPRTMTPGTKPPGTKPPGTKPPGTKPPGTKSPGTKPPGTKPPGTKPPGTKPPGTKPPGTKPRGTKPRGTRPAGLKSLETRLSGIKTSGDRLPGKGTSGTLPGTALLNDAGAAVPTAADPESQAQRRRWEEGRIDFTGADRFDNVLRRISASLERVQPAAEEPDANANVSPGPPPQHIESTTSELASGLSQLAVSPAAPSPDETVRRAAWERGQMDFMGSDSFDNILSKINQTLLK